MMPDGDSVTDGSAILVQYAQVLIQIMESRREYCFCPSREREFPMFKTNEGTVDRAIRILAGIALLALFFLNPDASWRNWALIGIVPLATGLLGTCPLYSILGLSTCPVKKV